MITYTLIDGSIVKFPERICFTRQENTVVLLRVKKIDISYPLVATLTVLFDGDTITVKRNIHRVNSDVVFPLTGILESLIDTKRANYINDVQLYFEYQRDSKTFLLGTVIKGSNGVEISPLTEQASPNNRPASPVLILYPVFNLVQSLFVPETPTAEYVLLEGTPSGAIYYEGAGGNPFIDVYSRDAHDDDLGIEVSCNSNSSEATFIQKTIVDRCTDGVMLKWIDKHSIPYFYRWSVESETDELSVDDTYTHLDNYLRPFDTQNKSITKTFKLHSRIVERDIYNLCKTILGCSEAFMLNKETNTWDRCYIEEGEAIDNGAPMDDLVIEVVKHEYGL